jgi:hypothetical protein
MADPTDTAAQPPSLWPMFRAAQCAERFATLARSSFDRGAPSMDFLVALAELRECLGELPDDPW